MKYDLDISVETKLSLLRISSAELADNELAYTHFGENAWEASHVRDYGHWKKANKEKTR